MHRALATAALAFLVTAAAYAQSTLTGKWEGQTPNGFALTLDLKATSTELTGTVTREAETATITEGRIDKNRFSFTAALGGQTETVVGELDGDQVKVWLERQGPERAITLKRAKGK
jgi:hypothetical protein